MRGLLGFYIAMLVVVLAIWIVHAVPASEVPPDRQATVPAEDRSATVPLQ